MCCVLQVAVEEGFNRLGTTTANATNLSRKQTFRVRDYASNSEENLKENGNDQCLTNNSASRVGYQTNHSDNNYVQRNASKIPGPKTNRWPSIASIALEPKLTIVCLLFEQIRNPSAGLWSAHNSNTVSNKLQVRQLYR